MPTQALYFLSDFGLDDPYVAIVKAQIFQNNPDLHVIDVTHKVSPGDIQQGAFYLWQLLPALTPNSLILAVVDPKVGSSQQSVLVKTKNHLWIGPDNGLLWTACLEDGVEEIYKIDVQQFNASRTFHGRDIYAQVAASSQPLAERAYLSPTQFKLDMDLFVVEKNSQYLKGEVLHIDHFGNAITNIRQEDCAHLDYISFKKLRYTSLHTHYAEVPLGCPLAFINSQGLLELACNGVPLDKKVKSKRGDPVKIYYQSTEQKY